MERLKNILKRITGKPDVYIDDFKLKIKNYLPANPIILEAGACDGRDTLQLAELWPNGFIHSFEPMPELFVRAKEKIARKKNVRLYPYAVGEITGRVTFHVSSGMSTGSGSILEPHKHLEIHPSVKFEKTIEVESFTIDDWAKQHDVGKIDFMWLDLQGAEYNVLKSAPNILSSLKVLFTEVSLIETYRGVKIYPEFRKWLEDQGFKVELEDLPYEDMGNVLFVKY